MNVLTLLRPSDVNLHNLAHRFDASAQLSSRGSTVPRSLLALALVMAVAVLGATPLLAQKAVVQQAQIVVANNAANGLVEPFGVAVDTQGNVYISDWSGRLLKETPSGIGFGGFIQSVVLGGLTQPNDVAVDANGNIYLAIPSPGQVIKLSPSSGGYTQTVIATTAANGIQQPSGVAVDASGNVYISDFTGGNVYKETLSGSSYTQSTVATYSANGLFEPVGVAVDTSGNVYIADAGNNRVVKETRSSGSYAQSVVASGLNTPFGVTVDSNGNVYIADDRNNRVVKETLSSGSYVQSVLVTGLSNPASVAVDAIGNLYIADTGGNLVLEEKSTNVDFGPVAVGSTSSTIALTFQFSASVTLSSSSPYRILTMGTTGLDYADAGSSTCSATSYVSGNTCVVNVNFTPKVSGTRNGAVVLVDSTGNLVATGYISGTGMAPQLTFSPGTPKVVANGGNGLANPWGVAVDGSGDVFICDYTNNHLYKETYSSGTYTQSTIDSGGLSYPRQIAVDGAGNVLLADQANGSIFKESWTGSGYLQSVVFSSAANGLTSPMGVAVDGSGNVYIVDSGNNRLLKETLGGSSYIQSVVTTALDNPLGVAVDGNGNLYVTDMLNQRVVKETPSGGSYVLSVFANNTNNGLAYPYGVAVDDNNNVYVSDSTNTVYEFTLTGGKYVQSVAVSNALDGNILDYLQGIAIDGRGNIYVANFYGESIVLQDRADSPVLAFGSVNYGSTSAVLSEEAANYGNQTLSAVSPGLSVPPGFTQVAGSGQSPDCAVNFSLVAGASCNLSIEFSPLSGMFGSVIGNILLTDNNLNTSSSTQSIELTATGVKGAPVITWPTPLAILVGTPLSSTQLNATANVPGSFVYTPGAGTVLSAGWQTLSVTFTPSDTADYNTVTTSVTLVVYAQTPMASSLSWVWMGGSSTVGSGGAQPGVYGSLGVAAPANVPGGRGWAGTWKDSQGNFWLFGGYGADSADMQGELNDLWEFIPSSEEWVWMGGSSTMSCVYSPCGQSGVYGTLGQPATTNIPGGRDSFFRWADSSGNLWIFGGEGFDAAGNDSYLNDLWEFTPSAGTWTWMGGSNTSCQNTDDDDGGTCGISGVYGQMDIPSASNLPGSRYSGGSWKDSSGNLWLFGGYGLDINGNIGDMNDLWEYSPATGQWTWVNGSSYYGSPGTYGSTECDCTPMPGARDSATHWRDASGNFWMFGGEGLDSVGNQGYLNDLWEYNPSTGNWNWVSGSSTVPSANGGQPGTYGTLGVASATNMPGGRWGGVGGVDTSGNFWIFGGSGFDSSGTYGDLNDAWKYIVSSNQWVWMGGSNTVGCPNCGQPGVYGTLGSPAVGNTPGGRLAPSGWTDNAGTFWIFGGSGSDATGVIGLLNDLWVMGIPAAQPVFSPSAGSYTSLTPVTITDATPNATIYYTTDGSTPTVNSTPYTTPLQVSHTTTITALATAPGYVSSPIATATYTISLTPLVITWPTPAAITYGTALSSAQLDATANVPGSFTYSPAAGTILKAGTQTLTATFTPTDTTDYNVTTATVTLTVNPATPTISWPTPAAITYGTALSATQLDATASTLGGFIYSPAAGTVLSGGNHTLSVTFTPTDTTDYTGASATTTITVNPARPAITWASPAAITYGTALSAVQLDATSSAAGTFAYSPAAGTVLKAGSQTLTVTFTPSNTADYSTTSATVQITVSKAALNVTAASASKVYGAALPALTYSITGFVNGDTAATAVTGTPVISTAATASSPVGSYPIAASIGTLAAANYSFQFVAGALAVTPASLTVTANNATAIYNQPLPGLTYSVTGYVNGDGPSALSGAPTESTSAQQGSSAGIYPITLSQGSLTAANYTFTLVGGLLTISGLGKTAAPTFNPAPTIAMSSQTVTLSDTTPGATIYYAFYGETPTTASRMYMGPVTVNSTVTIKAIAVSPEFSVSDVVTVTYTID
jgi:N-acetylneuraminic acid mutarotase/DNA-binding beta-propeller fold protein YncE